MHFLVLERSMQDRMAESKHGEGLILITETSTKSFWVLVLDCSYLPMNLMTHSIDYV